MNLKEKSTESLTVAKWCRDNGHFNHVLSSAYYAAYQSLHNELDEVGAPIDPEGVTGGERWEHKTLPGGAIEYLGLPEEMAIRTWRGFDRRVEADYKRVRITADNADQMILLAEEVREWIQKNADG